MTNNITPIVSQLPLAALTIPKGDRKVIKRDGRIVPWDQSRIVRAIALAYYDVQNKGAVNPYRDNPEDSYGLDDTTFLKAIAIAKRVTRVLVGKYYNVGQHPTIEWIQDVVEMTIVSEGEWEVARSFMLYRALKADHRINKYDDNGLDDYIAVAKYARYRKDLGRREMFGEAVDRVRQMHLKRFLPIDLWGDIPSQNPNWELLSPEQQELEGLINSAFDAVKQKKLLPSMRSLQFGGRAIEVNHARMYNCTFSHINRVRVFQEAMYLLLCGCGVGFSVQKHHVACLPSLPARKDDMDLPVKHFLVEDTIEGWADAVGALFDSYLNGYKVEFAYHLIRDRGTPLITSGGKAPGHQPLKRALEQIDRILRQAVGRKLKPIEAYDILMYLAKAVLAGGIRRSATICLFSVDDEEMMTAKTGNWFEVNPQRSASNNSAVILRKKCTIKEFKRLFELQKEFGEPGFFFTDNLEFGPNPCVEIGLNPVLSVTENDQTFLQSCGISTEVGEKLTGWQFCNLTTINGAACLTPDDFYMACRHAAVVGTLQAAYTTMPYLGAVTELINKREALLGVSICGIMDQPGIFLNPEVLETGAKIVLDTNEKVALMIGISPCARGTCVKPEGTASLLLRTGSGIHPHHARRYFRRVQANRLEPVYLHFKRANPHMTEVSVYSPDTDDVITFPVEAPPNAILRDDLTALQFLQYVRLVQKHWVQAGRRHELYSPNLHHNVSNTVTVKDDEWDAVCKFIWENREYFTGISMLQYKGDKVYSQAPREAVLTDEDIARWNKLRYDPVDYTTLKEHTDETALKDVVACAGGVCELNL